MDIWTVTWNNIYIGDNILTRVGAHCKEKYIRFLGVWLDDRLSFTGHIDKLKLKLNSGIYALSTCNKICPLNIRKKVYQSLFESHLRFGSIIYGSANPVHLKCIYLLQKKAVRLVAGAKYNSHTDPIFKSLNILKLEDIVYINQCLFVRQFLNKQLPLSFSNFFTILPSLEYRGNYKINNIVQQDINLRILYYFPCVQMIINWNRSNSNTKSETKLNTLKTQLTNEKIYSYDYECTTQNCYICK